MTDCINLIPLGTSLQYQGDNYIYIGGSQMPSDYERQGNRGKSTPCNKLKTKDYKVPSYYYFCSSQA